MLNRKIFAQLEQWFKSGIRKAAFLDGARQVGKTTAVRELARCHFDNFVEVNFIRTPMAKVDTGLVSHMMLKGMQFKVLNGDISVNEGALAENYVATELSSKGMN